MDTIKRCAPEFLKRMRPGFSISVPKSRKPDFKLSSACIVKCGKLSKSPPAKQFKYSSWTKRYFVLYDPTVKDNKFIDQTRYLIYYKEPSDLEPHRKISLEENVSVEEGKPINGFQWSIALRTKDRVYYLCAETENEHYNWLDALKETIEKQEENVDEGTFSFLSNPPQSDPSPEVNLKLREELDKMKLERSAESRLSTSVQEEPVFDNIKFSNITPTNSNKDSGIETGEDYINKKDLAECQDADQFYVTPSSIKSIGDSDGEIYGNIDEPDGYDPLPPRELRNSGNYGSGAPERPPKPFSDTGSHLIQKPSKPDQNALNYIEDDVYDVVPKTSSILEDQRFSTHEKENYDVLPDRDSMPHYVEDDVYDVPPKPSPTHEEHQFSTQVLDYIEDDVYDIPPKPSPTHQDQQFPTHEQENYNVLSDRNPMPSYVEDDVYDVPPKPSSTHQDQLFSTHEQVNCIVLPDQNPVPSHVEDDVYDVPPKPSLTHEEHQFSTHEHENYSVLPDRHPMPHYVEDDVYDVPPKPSPTHQDQQFSTIHEEHQFSTYGQETYRIFHDQNSLTNYVEDDVYDVPPKSSPTHQEQQDEIYGNIDTGQTSNYYNSYHDNYHGADVYDEPPRYSTNYAHHDEAYVPRTNSEIIQRKALPKEPSFDIDNNENIDHGYEEDQLYSAPSEESYVPRTTSDIIQGKVLPKEPSLDIDNYAEDELYSAPHEDEPEIDDEFPPKEASNYNIQRKSLPYEPSNVESFSCRTLPPGYDVVNNNQGVYDSIPQMLTHKPLPHCPREDGQKADAAATTMASSNNQNVIMEDTIYEEPTKPTHPHLQKLQNSGKIFRRFSFK